MKQQICQNTKQNGKSIQYFLSEVLQGESHENTESIGWSHVEVYRLIYQAIQIGTIIRL